MKTSLFDFELPPERIATQPVSPRDASRLLVARPERLEDRAVRELPELLREGDLLVFNDTKVIPARLHGKRGQVAIEVTLLKIVGPRLWRAFARPGKRLRIGDKIIFSSKFSAEVKEKYENGEVDLEWNNDDWRKCLELHGEMPLPPYMKRNSQATDNSNYQTVYAKNEGAVAAPTAGLHFTDELLQKLEARGIGKAFVTLHVGAGTFLPVKSEDTDSHIMHTEYIEVSETVANSINETRRRGGRIVAVGTTSLRTLESVAGESGQVRPMAGETSIFITPGYRFKIVDILMTNFHLPRSTLFMLVSAFSGLERMQDAYRHAIEANYRFYSYGDACLLFRYQGAVMGISLTWLAVKGKEEQQLLGEHSLDPTGATGEFYDFRIAGQPLKNGWYLMTMMRCGHAFQTEKHLAQLSQNAQVLACNVEEHVMFSGAAYWQNGSHVWSIEHAGDEERENLTVRGEPPEAFKTSRDRFIAKQADEKENVDWYFEIPLEIAEQMTGFKHDEIMPELDGGFKELVSLKPAGRKAQKPWWRFW